MEILNTKSILALGISGMISTSAAAAQLPGSVDGENNSIVSVSSNDLRVTVYDGIATLFGNAESAEEAELAEQQIRSIDGIDHVINVLVWE